MIEMRQILLDGRVIIRAVAAIAGQLQPLVKDMRMRIDAGQRAGSELRHEWPLVNGMNT